EATLWEADTGKPVHRLTGHSEPIRCACFSLDGKSLVTASEDGSSRIWETETGRTLKVLTLDNEKKLVPDAVALASDGSLVAVASSDSIHIWEVETGKHSCLNAGEPYALILSVSFSKDKSMIASGGRDGTTKVWDTASGKELITLRGNNGGVRVVTFSN